MSPAMHEECGGHCFLLMKPVLDDIVKLTQEIKSKNKELDDVSVELFAKAKLFVSQGHIVSDALDETT